MGLKEAYEEKADAQLREWQVWIEHYKTEPITTHVGKVMDRQRMTERLDDCHRIARVRLEELRTSQEDRWELAKQAVERAMIELKQVLDESGAGFGGRLVQLQPGRSHVYQPFQRKG